MAWLLADAISSFAPSSCRWSPACNCSSTGCDQEVVMIIRSILCPVDFSSESRTLVRAALAIAREEHATVTLLHVLEPLLVQAAALATERDWLEEQAYSEVDALIARAVEGS